MDDRELLKERLVAWRKGLGAGGLRVGVAKTTWREGVERTMGKRGLRMEMAKHREVWRNGIHGKCLTLAGKEKVT